jgi:hypothetical protein
MITLCCILILCGSFSSFQFPAAPDPTIPIFRDQSCWLDGLVTFDQIFVQARKEFPALLEDEQTAPLLGDARINSTGSKLIAEGGNHDSGKPPRDTMC